MLYIGDIVHGFAGGAFGRDGYGCKTIIGLGSDWCVARDTYGNLFFAQADDIQAELADAAKPQLRDGCCDCNQCNIEEMDD